MFEPLLIDVNLCCCYCYWKYYDWIAVRGNCFYLFPKWFNWKVRVKFDKLVDLSSYCIAEIFFTICPKITDWKKFHCPEFSLHTTKLGKCMPHKVIHIHSLLAFFMHTMPKKKQSKTSLHCTGIAIESEAKIIVFHCIWKVWTTA